MRAFGRGTPAEMAAEEAIAVAAGHEPADLGYASQSPDASGVALGQQVERHVAIAAEAIAVPPSRDDLRHDIDALVDQIAHRMGIVGRDIVALCLPIAEPAAGLEEKFIHPYAAAERGYVDAVIPPSHTRLQVAQALRLLDRKVVEVPAKKHGNIPL